ncbi:MAG TPA: hypothetical protein VM261_11825 [Kofleriaceae bacterium]|nr:hypothetical protein [Kofleriaceae bacterium]
MRALAAIAVLAACSDPTFDVSVRYEQLGVAADEELAAHVATLTVSVVDAEAAGDAAALADDATCEDVAFGRIPEAVLEGARRASVGALDTPRISGVPRLGPKLVIAEARNPGGRRVGAGCREVGDVESDATVDVLVEVAPRVRVFSRDEIGSQPSPVQLVVTAPWNDVLTLGDRRVVAELHSAGGVVEMPVEATAPSGLTRTPEFSLTEPGPAQTVVRVRWADEPLRVPAFVQWPSMGTVGGGHISLAADDGSRLARSWVSGAATVNGATAWGAAALQKRMGAPDEEVVVVRYNTAASKLVAVSVPAPGARSIGLWDRRLYTVTASGWNEVTAGGLVAVPGSTALGTGAATEIHAFDGCDGAPGAGLLVRRMGATADEFHAYSAPGQPAPAGDPLANLAALLEPGDDEIVGQACVDLGDMPVRIVATRSTAAGLVAWTSSGQRLVLSGVVDATSFQRGGTSFLAGVEGTITGPRVASYKLTNLVLGTTMLTGFVAVDGVDTELATLPLSFVVADLDGDDLHDVVAALPGLVGPRLQASFGRLVAGEQLASVSPALAGGRAATNPILRLEDVDAQGHKELVIMTDEGIDVLCFDVEGMECASAR